MPFILLHLENTNRSFMAYSVIGGLPPQQLSFSKKNKKWRKGCVDVGDSHSLLHSNVTRKSIEAMNINYDLMDGKLHMDDLKALVNPFNIDASFIPDSIQHYPIINSKIEVLKGEESKRIFDFRATVTNPNAISEMEEEKTIRLDSEVADDIIIQNLGRFQDTLASYDIFRTDHVNMTRYENRGIATIPFADQCMMEETMNILS